MSNTAVATRRLLKPASGWLVPGSAALLIFFFVSGLLAPWIAPYGLEDMDLTARLVMPFTSWAHPFGTDELGRDVFSRLLYSLRLSFILAVCGTILGAIVGTLLGFLAARFGGFIDDLVNTGVDFTASLPFIILALTILAFLGTDVTVIVVIMTVYGWDRYARLTRNLARSAYTEGYASAFGADQGLRPRNVVNPKQLEIPTADVTIRLSPDRGDLVETRIIDGARYILIRAEDQVNVNGVPVHIS